MIYTLPWVKNILNPALPRSFCEDLTSQNAHHSLHLYTYAIHWSLVLGRVSIYVHYSSGFRDSPKFQKYFDVTGTYHKKSK